MKNTDTLKQVLEAAAHAAHEANRAYCRSLGDFSHEPWDEAPSWQRDSALEGVRGVIEGNDPKQSHESWLRKKIDDGWKYGEKKDPILKEHPCMLPYAELPIEQRAKDMLFVHIVKGVLVACGWE